MHRPAQLPILAMSLLVANILLFLQIANVAEANIVPFFSQTSPNQPQRSDGLDSSLLSVNQCGSGEGDTQFTFAATGDTFPHLNIQQAGDIHGYDYLFDKVRPFLKAADLAYTNFDGAMLENSPHSDYPAFNYSPQLAYALKNAGIGLVSTANNHIMDRGPIGLDATLKVLEAAGIEQHGTISSDSDPQTRPTYLPLQLKRNGVTLKVAFLSFSWGTNGIPDPYKQVNYLWNSTSYGSQSQIRASVLEAVAKAKRENDFVIVATHWGIEYELYPNDEQIKGAQELAKAGADLIIGAQPHTLQPVDVINTTTEGGSHQTLVIYSLANFIAAQNFNQETKFSDTSTIFYVGLTRHRDGKVSLSGYRYLPMLMSDYDTRPAPLPVNASPNVLEHVRLEMRDFNGLRQISPDPNAIPNNHIEVCPDYTFPSASPASGKSVKGDFAQYYATLGQDAPVPAAQALAIIGYPLSGTIVNELSGDCSHLTSVLYTERQRLELQTDANWPYRVVGTQLGSQVYFQKYKPPYAAPALLPRLHTANGSPLIADKRFQDFFENYGGLQVFGYPISGLLTETSGGQTKTVQYFERARFEVSANSTDNESSEPLYRVQLGRLTAEYSGIGEQCGLEAPIERKLAKIIPDLALQSKPPNSLLYQPTLIGINPTPTSAPERLKMGLYLLLAWFAGLGVFMWTLRRK